jgi:hypothetical protein
LKFESWLTGEQKQGKEMGETRKEKVSLMSWQTRGATANPVGRSRWQLSCDFALVTVTGHLNI